MQKYSFGRKVVAVVLAAAAVTTFGAAPAQAEGTSGGSNYYDGKDPRTDNCNGAGNASQIATRPVLERDTGHQVATLQIFYSSRCGSNWIRVTANPYGGNATKYIESSLGGWNSEWDPGYGSSFSMMVYAPGTTRINGYVYLFEPGINEWNWKASASFSL